MIKRFINFCLDHPFIAAAILVLAIGAIVLVARSVVILGPGEVAVVYDPFSGNYRGPFVGPTWTVKFPWEGLIKDFYTVDYIEMSNRKDADYPAVVALTNDGVMVTVEMTFTYSVDPKEFMSLAINYPRIDYEEQRLVPVLRQVVRDVIAKHSVEEVIKKRDLIAREIEKVYREAIAADPTLRAIKLHEVNPRGVYLPKKVQDAIEEKIAAYQRKIAAQYEAERIETLARANATAMVIQAEAQRNATILVAQAQREAVQLLVNASGDVDVAKLWLIQQVPSNVKVILVLPSDSQQLPIILDAK